MPSVQATIRLSGAANAPIIRDTHVPGACETEPPTTLDTPGGRYHLIRELAHGGMGAVYRGFDRELRRELAIKVLLEKHLDHPEHVHRFHEEAWITGQLQHPGVVPIYDFGRLDSGQPYFIMKLVEGRTLAALLARRESPAHDRPRFLKIFEQICQTLAYAHSRGVIHRDLKPSNIMVGEFGEVQVMDWGLATILDSAPPEAVEISRSSRRLQRDPTRTAALDGEVLGTPAYMAPEQAAGQSGLDERCDVFGLGAILCEILTGLPPFDGARASAAFEQAKAADLAPMCRRVEACGADPDLIALVQCCMQADRELRPRDAGEVAWRMTEYLADVEERIRLSDLARTAAQLQVAEERKRRRLSVALSLTGVGLVMLLGLVTIGLLMLRHEREDRKANELKARMEQSADITRRVQAAFNEAIELRDQARRSDDPLLLWTRASDAARRATELGTDEWVEPALRRGLAALVTELDDEVRKAHQSRRNRQILARLEENRLLQTEVKDGRFDLARSEPAYRAAFQEYGIDFDSTKIEEAAERLRKESIVVELAVALANWADTRFTLYGQTDGLADRLLRTAVVIDSQAWRTRFYEALRTRNTSELRRLAETVDVASQPPSILGALANILQYSGNANLGISLFQKGVGQYPADFWLSHNLGMALYYRNESDEEAIRYLSAAVTLRPQSPGARQNLALVLVAVKAYAAALNEYTAAVRLKPDYAEAHAGRGLTLLRLGQRDEAILALKKAVELRPHYAQPYQDLGLLYSEMSEWPLAAQIWKKGTEVAPKNAVLHYNLANALRSLGKFEESVRSYETAIQLQPQYAEAYCNLGHTLRDMGRFALAHQAMSRGHELGAKSPKWNYPSESWVKRTSELLARDERLGVVLAGADSPRHAEEALALAQFCFGQKKWAAASLPLFQFAFERDPNLREGPRNSYRTTAQYAVLRALENPSGQPTGLDANARAYWLAELRAWMQADLVDWNRLRSDQITSAVGREVEYRLNGTEWKLIRDEALLATLPAKERAAWARLWSEIQALNHRLPR